jgi:hypothetical protein
MQRTFKGHGAGLNEYPGSSIVIAHGNLITTEDGNGTLPCRQGIMIQLFVMARLRKIKSRTLCCAEN